MNYCRKRSSKHQSDRASCEIELIHAEIWARSFILAAGLHNFIVEIQLIESANIKLAELAQGKLKSKKAELRRALEGCLTQMPRWVLAELLTRVEGLEATQAHVETRIGEEGAACAEPFVPGRSSYSKVFRAWANGPPPFCS